MMIGIGFRERDTAFDFKNCLNEYVRYIDRMALAARMSAAAEDETHSHCEAEDLQQENAEEGQETTVGSTYSALPRQVETVEGADKVRETELPGRSG